MRKNVTSHAQVTNHRYVEEDGETQFWVMSDIISFIQEAAVAKWKSVQSNLQGNLPL